MKKEIEVLKPVKEEIVLVRFMFDDECKKVHFEAKSNKYDVSGRLINSEPIYLRFRDQEYEDIKQEYFKNLGDRVLQLFVEKLIKKRKET